MQMLDNKKSISVEQKIKLVRCAWILTVIVSILSQIPAIAGFFRPLMYMFWMVDLIGGFILGGFKVPGSHFLYLYTGTVLVLIGECLICYVTKGTHLDSFMLRVIPLPIICYAVGLFSAGFVDKKTVKITVFTFLLSVLFMCVFVYVKYIGSLSYWINADHYLYAQKNSAGQIIGCSAILGFFLFETEKVWMKVAKYASILYMIFMIAVIQCRTSLLGIILSVVTYLVVGFREKRKLAVIAVIAVLVVLAICLNPVAAFFGKAFGLKIGGTQSADELSSGRLTWYRNAIKEFISSPITGTGHHRVDDLYLCLLADVGIVGFIPVIILWAVRFFRNVSGFFRDRNSFTTCLLCMTVFYSVESLLEAYPPFGPGVCTFAFWIASSFLDLRGKENGEK